jgi:hypothetical protein
MQNTNTSVLTRRLRIDGEHATLPYEAGWASEAVFFLQTEGEHPELSAAAEVSPDGINWVRRGAPVVLPAAERLLELPITVFGNWVRLVVSGATPAASARILIHLNLKG